MLELNEITKSYSMGAADAVQALKGINIKFRRCDLVSILGPSGCGKSTTLNIIGGLDQYTTGDLVINGRSTKGFNDRDWDNYRNHSVGFIFQSYNLIRHQSVLDNVELALTLSGVSKKDRREKAKKALIDVGLGDHIDKTPKEMSGGQMQRVAIARALVNNPDIILADEPTGALDSKTSVQVMEILKEVAKDRLVVMVTHNPELAMQYSTRIIRMKDGEVVEDTRPLSQKEIEIEKERDIQELKAANIVDAEAKGEEVDHTTPRFKIFKNLNNTKLKTPKELIEQARIRRKQPHLSHKDQFKLSLKNLFTKKGRTILTAFAGSVGIFGIGAVLAISQGMNGYIQETEEKTLSSTPLTISSSATDFTVILQSVTDLLKNGTGDIVDPERAKDPEVWRKNVVGNLAKIVNGAMKGENNLGAFKKYLDHQIEDPNSNLSKAAAGLYYNYNLNLSTYYPVYSPDGKIADVKEANLLDQVMNLITNHLELNDDIFQNINIASLTPIISTLSSLSGGSSLISFNMWEELLTANNNPNEINPMIKKQYELVGENSKWPENYNDIIVVCDANYEIPDISLYSLGLIPEDEMACLMNDAINGTHEWEEKYPDSRKKWKLSEIMNFKDYKLIPNYCFYKKSETESSQVTYTDVRDVPGQAANIYENDERVVNLNVCGIVKLKKEFASSGGMIGGAIGYTQSLRNYIVENAKKSDICIAQNASPEVDVLSGLPFKTKTETEDSNKAVAFRNYISKITTETKGIDYTHAKADVYRRYHAKHESKAEIEKILDSIQKEFPFLEQLIKDIFGDKASIQEKIMVAALVLQGMDEKTAKDYVANIPDDKKEALINTIYSKVLDELIVNRDIVSDANRAKEFDAWYKSETPPSDPTIDPYACGYQWALKNSGDGLFATWYNELIEFSKNNFDDNLLAFGQANLDCPASIKLFANTFNDKSKITDEIDKYNVTAEEAAKIKYTDYVGFIMSSVGKILNIITYVLIAFAAISLVVSSIMIAVITL
ncbi:MAG: ABC transporter ATP-binding protein, partial [Bacilli bacterium]|nr:ABC transporter ATP-binding protein [Bacilli bacterium]